MARISKSEIVPQQMKAKFDAIVGLTDKFCGEHLNEEYAKLSRQLTAALCRKRPSPLLQGRINSWACGIMYALGFVNFLFDKNTEPYMNATDLCKSFGISKSTGSAKSREVRDVFNMMQMDPNWCLPSEMNENPVAWMIMLDGFVVDVRTAPRSIQETAYQKGLIPYIPDIENKSPKSKEEEKLINAVEEDNIDIVQSLLSKNVDVNAKDEDDMTVLMHAASNGYHRIARFLIRKGADVNAKDDMGNTALMWAADEGHFDMVKLLLNNNADINAQDDDGTTALISAANAGYLNIVKLLINNNADVNAKDENGETALMYAAYKGYLEIVELFKKAGAKK